MSYPLGWKAPRPYLRIVPAPQASTSRTSHRLARGIASPVPLLDATWYPEGTSIETLVAVESHRRAIEDSFETAKNEFGLDHNESRSWHGWHRHVKIAPQNG